MADILLRGVAVGLEVPGARLSDTQRGVDDPAPALTCAHLGIESREVPSARDFPAEFVDAFGFFRALSQVVALAGIEA